MVYSSYGGRADFSKFELKNHFDKIINWIEILDLCENVYVGIPVVVWKELTEQICNSYNENMEDIERLEKNFIFPFCEIKLNEGNYLEYIEEEIKKYKKSLQKEVVNIIELSLPSEKRFESIIEKAFGKKQPFEGPGKSDKGFKDALIWESIIEYKENNIDKNIILFTNDKIFGKDLKEEYRLNFSEDIQIICDDDTLFSALENISVQINNNNPIPESNQLVLTFEEWIYSEDFKNQLKLIEPEFGIKTDDITLNDLFVIDIVKTIAEYDEILVKLKINAKFSIKDLINEVEHVYHVSVLVYSVDGIYNIQRVNIDT